MSYITSASWRRSPRAPRPPTPSSSTRISKRATNRLLIDRNFEEGDEPVKVCVRDGKPIELRKRVAPGLQHDTIGESVGFFRLDESAARRLAQLVAGYIDGSGADLPHEEAVRDLLQEGSHCFEVIDVTGVPWIEIDFAADVLRAEHAVLPRLRASIPRSLARRAPARRARGARGEGPRGGCAAFSRHCSRRLPSSRPTRRRPHRAPSLCRRNCQLPHRLHQRAAVSGAGSIRRLPLSYRYRRSPPIQTAARPSGSSPPGYRRTSTTTSIESSHPM